MKKLFLFFTLAICGISSYAYDVEVDGIYYNIVKKVKTAEVVSSNSSYTGSYTGYLEIPSTISVEGEEYNVTSIGDKAFYQCYSLYSLSIPNSIQSIGVDAFFGCGFHEFSIPESVTTIKRSAFAKCNNLVSVILPSSLTEISEYLFNSCSKLSEVEIPSTITSIGEGAFCRTKLSEILIPGSVKSIGKEAFESCTELSVLNLENGIETIGDYAFSKCSSLVEVSIPESLTNWGTCTFKLCTSLSNVNLPNNLTDMGNQTFENCTSLVSFEFPEKMERIGGYFFSGCVNLSNIILPNSIKSIGGGAFRDCSGLQTVTLPNSISVIPEWCFDGCTQLKEIAIPYGVTSIGFSAFSGCRDINKVTIPESVTIIYSEAFKGCDGIETVDFGNSLERISGSAFKGCTNIKEIEIPNSVKYIDISAFKGCSNLISIKLGKLIQWLDYEAFSDCKELADVYCYAQTLPTTNSTTFSNSYIEYCTLHVPSNSIELYCTSSPWKDFGTIVAIEEPVISATSISLSTSELSLYTGEYASLTVTVLPDDVTDGSISWATSNADVATVNEGLIKAVSAGTATITATTNDGTNLSATCEVTVTDPVVLASDIYLSSEHVALETGETITLTANVSPADVTDGSVTWTTSNAAIATVTDGLVKAVSAGTATITATTNDGTNLSATCEVTVTEPIVLASSIEIIPSTLSLYTGESKTVTVKILPENVTDGSFTWGCTNWDVVSIDDNGVVTAISAGEASICAMMQDGSDKVAFCQVTVTDPTVWATDIQLDYADLTLVRNETIQLTATVLPENTTDNTVKWASNKPTIASVDDNGLVTAKKIGTATITAKTNDGTNLKAQCVVTVLPILVESIELNYGVYTLDRDESVQLIATVYPEDADNKQVIWSSSDASVVSVKDNGWASFVSVGTAIVTASAADGSGVSADCMFTVIDGIEEILVDYGPTYFYAVDGRRVSATGNGFYVIRDSNGNTKKVLISK